MKVKKRTKSSSLPSLTLGSINNSFVNQIWGADITYIRLKKEFVYLTVINEVYLNEYDSFEEALCNIGNFIEIVSRKKRLHSSLGYLPPEEFEAQVLAGQHQKVERQLTLIIK